MAFIYGIGPIIGFSFMALIAYDELNRPFNNILCAVFLIAGVLAGRYLFKNIQRRGVMNVISGLNASYDVDTLEPNDYDYVYKSTAKELASQYKTNPNFPKEVMIKIWGDWEGRKLNKKNKIENIDFDEDRNILTIGFEGNSILKVRNMGWILFSKTYLKIMKAEEVLWRICDDESNKKDFSYLFNGEKLLCKSNTDWKPHKLDVGIGMDTVYLQG